MTSQISAVSVVERSVGKAGVVSERVYRGLAGATRAARRPGTGPLRGSHRDSPLTRNDRGVSACGPVATNSSWPLSAHRAADGKQAMDKRLTHLSGLHLVWPPEEAMLFLCGFFRHFHGPLRIGRDHGPPQARAGKVDSDTMAQLDLPALRGVISCSGCCGMRTAFTCT